MERHRVLDEMNQLPKERLLIVCFQNDSKFVNTKKDNDFTDKSDVAARGLGDIARFPSQFRARVRASQR